MIDVVMTRSQRLISTYQIGIDVGGTFTDLVSIDSDGSIRTAKAFSTPQAPEEGVFSVIERAAQDNGLRTEDLLSRVQVFAHGTTVATNALIQRNGAKVGALFTHGFEDTLAIGRGPVGRVGGLPQNLAMDFLHTEPPPPLVPRDRIRGVHERIGSDGEIVIPLNEDQLRHSVSELIEEGVESLAICFLWSFRNPTHEQRAAAIVSDVAPDLSLSLSCDIAPKMGEFERAVTTAINAFVGPLAREYLEALETGLSRSGLERPVQVITSRGGAARVANIGQQAVSVVNSGPVGGLMAARYLGDVLGHDRIITADMGGTTFDVGLVDGRELAEEPRPFLAQGLPVLLPAVKLVTIGAGGGSVAWTDGYRLHVGPRSAGSVPGPAAYGKGGTEPTVTDALIVCGILNPGRFFDGSYQLDADLSGRAIKDHIAGPLSMSTTAAAAGIIEIVNTRMANLIRKVSIESGYDPRAFHLYAYGGATGAHCADFAGQLGIKGIVLPFAGPVFSALGAAIADISYAHVRSEPVTLSEAAVDVINRNFCELRRLAARDIREAGLDETEAVFASRVEMRYRDQMNEISVTWPGRVVKTEDWIRLRELFEAEYERRFGTGVASPGVPLEVVSFRVDATYPTGRPQLKSVSTTPSRARGPEVRSVYTHGSGWREAAIYDFGSLVPGDRIDGTAVIERDSTTVWLPEQSSAGMDDYGNLLMEVSRQ